MVKLDIHTLQYQKEGQLFDRKSFRIDGKSLAVILVAFANADGGDVVIGIEDDGRITGVNGNQEHLNELLRAPFDFCVPSVKVDVRFVDTQIKEYTFLGEDARFVTIPQYPSFCWTELIVNAVAHRDYSILGTDIMVKIFDHHYVVESPGILPGMVRIENIRQMHFSRNPKIAEFMREYKLVKEFGEGVDRMFREMAEAGNPAPIYKQVDFMVKVRLNSALREDNENLIKHYKVKGSQTGSQTSSQTGSQTTYHRILNALKMNPLTTREQIAIEIGISERMVAKYIKEFQENGIVKRRGGRFGGYWEVFENKANAKAIGKQAIKQKTGDKTEKINAKLESGPESTRKTVKDTTKTSDKQAINSKTSDKQATKSKASDKYDHKQAIILEYLSKNSDVTTNQMSVVLKISLSRTRYYLNSMVKSGLIVAFGANKNRTYRINNEQLTIDTEQ